MYIPMTTSRLSVPAAIAPIPAGKARSLYPETEYIDLNDALASGDCILLRVEGHSMDSVIRDGDMVVVDRARYPKEGDMIAALIPEGFTIKSFHATPLRLVPKNDLFAVIEPEDLSIIGVVRFVISRP
jgi:SOS-response transcriptional repressor LexA